jgi:hypothetical protein
MQDIEINFEVSSSASPPKDMAPKHNSETLIPVLPTVVNFIDHHPLIVE